MEAIKQKISIREKLSFALVTLGNIPVMVLINSFLLIFYTDVIGLNPAAVGTLFLIARFFDALTDPLIGYFLDHRKASKRGRFLPVLTLFGIITALNFLLLWFAGVWMPVAQLAIVYLVYMLFGITFSMLDISGNSILAVITQNRGERDTLSVIRGVCQILGGTIIGVAAPIIISNASSLIAGYYYLIIGATLGIAIFTLTGAAGIKERVRPEPTAEKYKIRDVFRIFSYRPLLVVFLLFLATGLGSSLQTSVSAFFFTHVIGDLSVMGLVMGFGIIGMIMALALAKLLMSRVGKKRVAIIAMSVLTIGCLIRFINPINIPLQIVGSIVFSFGMGLFTATMPAMIADGVDAVDNAMGFRAEGVIFSLSSFIAKVTMGLGGAIPGYILAIVGYDANADVQPAIVNNAIIGMLLLLPAVFYIISGIVFGILYKNTPAKDNQNVGVQHE
jgi:GPH family glycoside/pentoside/hexuronide:cation symporter/glucuronide carrier protein